MDARGKPVTARTTRAAGGQPGAIAPVVRGRPVTGGGLGYARRLPRGGAPARTAPPPGPSPRTGPHGNPPLRTRELAGARTASGHEHQGDEAEPRLDPAEVKGLAPAWSGEKCAPRTTCEE